MKLIATVMNQLLIAANIDKSLSIESVRFVKHKFYGMKRVPINRLSKLNSLFEIINTDCDIEIDKPLRKIYSKYDY